MSEPDDETFELDDDGGNAKSVEEVGKDGLAEDSGISSMQSVR